MADNQTTMLADLINPEVMAPIISYELTKALRFTPLAVVDTALQGQPGSKLTLPKFGYIGDATDIPEGTAIPTSKLTTSKQDVEIKKAGKGVELTDEAVLSGLGDPMGEGTKQLGLAIANKVDNDLLAAATNADNIAQTATVAQTGDGVQDILDIFNTETPQNIVIIAAPKVISAIRADARRNDMGGSDFGANAFVSGQTFDVLGAQLITSNKFSDETALQGVAILVDPAKPALKLSIKRGLVIEPDRIPASQKTDVYATEHYAAYAYHTENIIRLTFNPKA